MPKYDVFAIGEAQLRLTVNAGERLRNASTLRVDAAGTEANVASVLAQLGWRSGWASHLPVGELADRSLVEFRAAGVDLAHVVRSGDQRVALYFLEPGVTGLAGQVHYDRENTAFRDAQASSYAWDSILDSRMFFVSGITAALTPTTRAVVDYAVAACRDRGVRFAFDVNYRSKLWSAAEARSVLEPWLEDTDTLFCSARDAQEIFGSPADPTEVPYWLKDRFGAGAVVSTAGPLGVAAVDADGTVSWSDTKKVEIVDRPGAGDAMVGGTLHGVLSGLSLAESVRLGQRAAQLALTHRGDVTWLSRVDLDGYSGADEDAHDIVR